MEYSFRKVSARAFANALAPPTVAVPRQIKLKFPIRTVTLIASANTPIRKGWAVAAREKTGKRLRGWKLTQLNQGQRETKAMQRRLATHRYQSATTTKWTFLQPRGEVPDQPRKETEAKQASTAIPGMTEQEFQNLTAEEANETTHTQRTQRRQTTTFGLARS